MGEEGTNPNGLAAVLRQLRDVVLPLRPRAAAAHRIVDLLERDLLPRTAGGDTYLVCGIVGPNNAGKSALFNALIGRDLSPSEPAGGATRRLVGATAPELLARLQAEPMLARFRLCAAGSTATRLEGALQPASDPAELLVVTDETLPASLMLIDTPDFDSILQDNRMASESLLAVADLVVAVVTRHSYQNREVVRFLDGWLDHGRPWILVYNEAIDEDVAGAHGTKLSADVGHPPLAAYWAPHSLSVQQGTEPLRTHPLSLEGMLPPQGVRGIELRDLLFDAGHIAEVKSQAFVASMARLEDDIDALCNNLTGEIAEARNILAAAQTIASGAATEVAAAAMPAGPFVTAFRVVLDRRSNPLSRGWRATLRGLRLQLEGVVDALRGRARSAEAAVDSAKLEDVERSSLHAAWSAYWEELARDLGPESRHEARRSCQSEATQLLDADLRDDCRSQALTRASQALTSRAADLGAFQLSCEDLIEQAIEERGFDIDIQAAADLATLAPLALAAAVIMHTGGIGTDLAVAGGGAVSTFLLEKYSHVLGSGILTQARRRWAQQRGTQLASLLVDAALERTAPELRQRIQTESTVVESLGQLREQLS